MLNGDFSTLRNIVEYELCSLPLTSDVLNTAAPGREFRAKSKDLLLQLAILLGFTLTKREKCAYILFIWLGSL